MNAGLSDSIDAFMASYAGIDGGNPKASIWICGIEHGGDFESLKMPLRPEHNLSSWDDDFRSQHPEYCTWQYHRKVAKLMVALRDLQGNFSRPSPPEDAWRQYLKDELYVSGGESFKLNLFPLSSPSVNSSKWREFYSEHLGFESKDCYYKRCRNVRFPFLNKIREEFRPHIVLGTGKTFRSDFSHAFGFDENSEICIKIGKTSQRDCYLYEDNYGVLIVCPFFGGRYGINSDELLFDLAKLIDKKRVERALRQDKP